MIKILGIPFTSREGAVSTNVESALRIIKEEIRKEPADIVMLPEMFTCGYCALNLVPYAEPVNGPTSAKFRACCDELGVAIGYGFAETSGEDKVYNSWSFIEPGASPKVYRKTHLHPYRKGSPTNEREFLLAGNTLDPFPTAFGKVGVMICYDGFFVEVTRTLVLKGADLILWPSRSGDCIATVGLPAVRALENTVPVVQVDGGQDGPFLPLCAWSVAASSTGTVLASHKGDKPYRVEVDIEEGRRLRASADSGIFSLYTPRRPELYNAIITPRS